MTAVAEHVHNAFLCPFHVRGCDCEDLHNTICNAYRRPGYCPDNIDQMPELRVIVRYATGSSVYEVDHTGPTFRARRIAGERPPATVEPDGEWWDVSWIDKRDDDRLVFWRPDDTHIVTSPVVAVRPA